MRKDDAWLLLSLAAIFFWSLIPVQGFDIWFYLEVGRQVVENHHIPWSESFLGSTKEFAFGRHANHAWLSYTIYYLFYKTGGLAGLIVARSLLVTATAFVTYLNCRLLGLAKHWSAMLILLGVWTIKGRFLLRSVLFTDLYLAVLLYLLFRFQESEEGDFPYLPVGLLFVLWTNTHQGVSVGGVCLLLWLLTRRLPWKTRMAALVIGGSACLIRPYGWWYPYFFTETFGNTAAISGVLEWTPLTWMQTLQALGPLLLVTLVALVVALRQKDVPWGNLLFGLAFLWLAVNSQRAVGELLPIFTPVVASLLTRCEPSKKLLPPALCCLAALYWAGWLGVSPSRLTRLDPKYPEGLIAELPERHGQIFNSYEFGNYLVYRRQFPFIHGITALYREQLVLDFQDVLDDPEKRESLLQRFAVTEAMIHHPTAEDSTEGFLHFLAARPEWHLHWWDDSGYYFRLGEARDLKAVKPWSNPPWEDRQAARNELEEMLKHRASGLAFYLLGQLELEEGNPKMALSRFEESLQLTPLYYPALLAHGTTSFRLGDMEAAEVYLKRAAEANPSSAIAQFNLALLMIKQERFSEAREFLEKTVELKPDFPKAQELLRQLP